MREYRLARTLASAMSGMASTKSCRESTDWLANFQARSADLSTLINEAYPIWRKIGCRAEVASFSNSARALASSVALRLVSWRTKSNTALASARFCF